ncbi:putative membrane protein [Wickerhamomyces ciferrii]|uniref:Protein BIG1 n=1 Tax=Wickerhamomyces ciferrii (strain ATCC 14091 / BCRC 22168 / CBS 111 / JCM 3599 / NBRC 0793 / NRRL Y-1031 F-60-10) TaxID=1206466 RepID=K0KNS1_WICCF|nr:uncharacterized protein BN7_3361 [Wickerhamomyces ciferrii]CCH43807.1 putative membrane protein [Wickerhamomyces ciferrii]
MYWKSFIAQIFVVSLCFQSACCSVPLIVYSHLLVPKLQAYINNFKHLEFPIERLNEVTKKAIEPCTSDAYVLVNHPGLTLEDLQDPSLFKFLRTYMLMSSSLGAIPRAEKPVDFDKLEDLAISRCGAHKIEVDGLEEVPTYIDSRTRVIRVNFPRLPEDPEERKEALIKADEALRHTLRKLPSPHHTMIYTNQEPGVLNKLKERKYSKLDIFEDITREPTRQYEVERNIKEKKVEPYFHEKRTNLIDRKASEPPKFFDADFLIENEVLVLGIVGITLVLFIHQTFLLLKFLVKRAFRSNKQVEEKKNK